MFSQDNEARRNVPEGERQMKIVGFLAGLVSIAIATAQAAAQEPNPNAPPGPDAPAARPLSPDEQAIRAAVDAFVKAFNAGDARAVAALYTPDAQLIDARGEVADGRAAIEEEYRALFSENPGLTIEIRSELLKMLTPDAAIEDGISRVVHREDKVAVVNRYTAVHVKRDGRWLTAQVRETRGVAPSAHEQLEALAWLVGDWVDEASDSKTRSVIRWSTDKNFLLHDFTINSGGHTALTGTQRIGWDPHTGQIKSWVFDSAGGHGEGLWARLGNTWVVKATAVREDGRKSTATHIISREGPDSCRWRTTDRTLGGDVIVGNDDFLMVRQPPQPNSK
jgi:uncharacterized protein (TIGR02246 family)